jgi:hypothetical protein
MYHYIFGKNSPDFSLMFFTLPPPKARYKGGERKVPCT